MCYVFCSFTKSSLCDKRYLSDMGTSTTTPSAEAPMQKGEPQESQSQTENYRQLITSEGELASARDTLRLSNTKWSALNSCLHSNNKRTPQVEFVYVCLHIDVCNNNNQRGEKAMGGAGRRKGKWRNDVIRFYLKFKSCQSENYTPQTFLLKW